MIFDFFKRLFTLEYDYSNVLDQQRSQRLLYLIGFLSISTSLWIIFLSIPGILGGQFTVFEIVAPTIFIVNVFLYTLIQRGHIVWAARIFVMMIFMTNIAPQLFEPNLVQIGTMILPIVLAGILLNRNELLLITSIAVFLIIRGALLGNLSIYRVEDALAISISVFMSGVFLAVFNSGFENITTTAGDLILKTRRLGQRERITNDITNIQSILATAINQLRDDLGYSYIRIVILDDNQQPDVIYYSSIGVERIAQTTNFNFTSTSAFQVAINEGKSQIITQQDPGNISAHLLPASSSGLIIPAQSFNQIVALFDIQTESPEPIDPSVLTVLELYVESIASSLVYHRMVTTLRNDIQEQQAIINQQRTQIDNLQTNQTEGIVTNWQAYLEQRGLNAIGYDINDKREVSELSEGEIPENLRSAFEDGKIIVETIDNGQNVIIPIQFRETIVGAIGFQIPKEIPITDRKLDFIRSVTERLALALDNKRLLEQTQIQAQRESTANEIGNVLLSSTDVQSVLQTAVERFNQALGAVSTRIYLQPQSLQSVNTPQREDAV